MQPSRLTTLMVFLVPQILSLIIKEYQITEEKATELLYASALYQALENERTKLWHLSANALFVLFKEEQETGKITYPEEG